MGLPLDLEVLVFDRELEVVHLLLLTGVAPCVWGVLTGKEVLENLVALQGILGLYLVTQSGVGPLNRSASRLETLYDKFSVRELALALGELCGNLVTLLDFCRNPRL